ncbi:MAG: hypothetical protein CM15mP119_2100 [Alphaproteobacteria bacterium]|nr:MAG: hypothetical protein CM15mP119_2100 [Alphaproteobacteria bacterium]
MAIEVYTPCKFQRIYCSFWLTGNCLWQGGNLRRSQSIFEIVEGVMASIDPLREINELAVVQGKARVKLGTA